MQAAENVPATPAQAPVIEVAADLRRTPWVALRGGAYREGEIRKVGLYTDGETGPLLAVWCALTDGSEAVVYAELGQAVDVTRQLRRTALVRPFLGRWDRARHWRMRIMSAVVGVAVGVAVALIFAVALLHVLSLP